MESVFLQVNGIQIHCRVSGNPQHPALVFLHGFPEFWYAWQKQIGFFESRDYYLIIPDQRGYHLSDKPSAISAYRLSILAEDIIAVLDALKVDKCLLVGHDWGAAVAYYLGAKFSRRIHKLIILQLPHPQVIMRYIRHEKAQRKRFSYIYFFQIPWMPESALRKNNYRRLRHALLKFSKKGTFLPDDIGLYLSAWQQKNTLRSMLNWYRAAFWYRSDIKAIGTISLPTQIYWGEKDAFMMKEMIRDSMPYFTEAELHYFPEGTHWIHHELPDELNQSMLEFMEG
jgi:epoxide hydrolase 4